MEKLTSASYRTKFWITLLVAVVLLLPRWVALDRFVTVDEPDWVKFSANFYYAITHKDLARTYESYHPGVTTLWIGALAVYLKSPQYRGWGQGYFDDTVAFMSMLAEKGVRFLDILVLGRQIMVMVELAVLLALFLLLWRTFGLLVASLCTWLIAFDPYYLGHSRLLTQEGLLSALLLLSILAYFSFEYTRREWVCLVVSGISAGIACLTKSPGIIIIPMVALIVLLHRWVRWREPPISTNNIKRVSTLRNVLVPLLFWAVILCAVYFVFWPSMWVDPIGTLSKVYSAAQSFVEQGDASALMRVGAAAGSRFNLGYYLSSLLWRSSPVVWLGVTSAVLAVFRRQRDIIGVSLTRWATITLIVFAFLFVLMMAIGGAKSGGHYIISSHLALDVVAGLGYAAWLEALWGKAASGLRQAWIGLAIAVLAIFQCVSAAWYYPYYLNYYNPLLGGPRLGAQQVGVGYGEVLDQAAHYLAQLPDSEKMTVMSWYGPVSFAPFYPGKTVPLWPRMSWTERDVERLRRSDYLVIYYQHQVNRNLPPSLLAGLKDVTPWHAIFVHGVEYIRIYPVEALPQEVFEPDVDQ